MSFFPLSTDLMYFLLSEKYIKSTLLFHKSFNVFVIPDDIRLFSFSIYKVILINNNTV